MLMICGFVVSDCIAGFGNRVFLPYQSHVKNGHHPVGEERDIYSYIRHFVTRNYCLILVAFLLTMVGYD